MTELKVGVANESRWVEILNPSAVALSLAGVYLSVGLPGDDKVPLVGFELGKKVPNLPAGEVLLVGHLPPGQGKPGDPYLASKMIDLGPTFVLPCAGTLHIQGPGGTVDTAEYDLCKIIPGLPVDAPWPTTALDPAHTTACANDDSALWCVAGDGVSAPGPSPGKANFWCDLDKDGYGPDEGDCNDSAASVHPGAVEQCNGVDEDCDGETDEDIVAPVGTCQSDGICQGPLPDGSPVAQCDSKDGFVCSYPFGYESVNETLCDGFDNDCDGQTDEGLLNACGKCGAEPAEICNGADDDCDGETDEAIGLLDIDCGKAGVCTEAVAVCHGVDGPWCQLPLAWQATETLCDGLDNDCDGKTDEDLGLQTACTTGTGACSGQGVLFCGSAGAVVCSGVAGEPSDELCGDAIDNDCDGETDDGFGIGEQCAVGVGVCQVTGKRVCSVDRRNSACNVVPATPASGETCGNGLDDDCDGVTDEAGCTTMGADPGCSAQSSGGGGSSTTRMFWLIALAGLALVVARRRARS